MPRSASNLGHVLSHWPSLVPVAPADISAGQVHLPTEGFDTAAAAMVSLNTFEVQHLIISVKREALHVLGDLMECYGMSNILC